MNEYRLSIVIDANGRPAIEVINKLTGASQGLGAAQRNLAAGADHQAQATRRASAELESMGGTARQVQGFLVGVFGAAIVREIISTTNRIDGMRRTLEGVLGSGTAAARGISFIRSEADRLGVAFQPALDGYTKLSAAAQGTELAPRVNELTMAIVQAGRAFNSSGEQIGGAITAVEQMISKGTVSAEELRGQLGERIPGAFGIAARAMGVTTAELDKMLSKGEVVATDFLPKFAAELSRSTAAAAALNAASPSAEIERIHNQLETIATQIGTGFFEGLGTGLADFRESLSEVDLRKLGQDIGIVVGVVAEGAGILARNIDVVTDALILFAGARGAGAAIGALKLLRAEVASTGAWVAAGTAATGYGSKLAALAGGPIGIAVAALGVLTLKVKENWDAIIAAEQRGARSVATAQGSIASGFAGAVRPTSAIESDVERLSNLMSRDRGREQALERHRKSLEALQQQYIRAGGSVEEWNAMLERSTTAAQQARTNSSNLAVALGNLNAVSTEAGTVQGKQAKLASELGERLKKLAAIEKTTPAITGEVQRVRQQLLATYQKEVVALNGATTTRNGGNAAIEREASARRRLMDIIGAANAGESQAARLRLEFQQDQRSVNELVARYPELASLGAQANQALARSFNAAMADIDPFTARLRELEEQLMQGSTDRFAADLLTLQVALDQAIDAGDTRRVEELTRAMEQLEIQSGKAATSSDVLRDANNRMAEDAKRAAEESSRAWVDFADGLADAMLDGSAGVKRYFKQLVDDLKRQLISSGLQSLFRSVFNLDGSGGGFNLGSLFGGAGGQGGGALGGILGGITTGGGIVGSISSGLFGSAGVGGLLAGLGGSVGAFGAGMTVAGSAGLLAAGQFGVASLAAGNLAVGLGALVPVVGWIVAAGAAINAISGGRLFGTSYKPTSSSTTLDLGENGGTAGQTVREVRQRALFGGRQWRTRNVEASDEAVEAAEQLFASIRGVMTNSARALQGEVPPMIDAALRTVLEYDSKGKVKATKFFVDLLGRTWEEESAEAATNRIVAEAMIATIDSVLGTTVAAASEVAAGAVTNVVDAATGALTDGLPAFSGAFENIVKDAGAAQGEASAIAERWREDSTLLLQGAGFLLAAATDMRNGTALITDGTLTQITDLVEGLGHEGETMIQSYARLQASTQLYLGALGVMDGALQTSTAEIVQFADGAVEAMGGLDAATQQLNVILDAFFTDAERNALRLQEAQARAARAQADLGVDGVTFDNYRARFAAARAGGLSPEEFAAWVRLGVALANAAEATDALTESTDTLADSTGELADTIVANGEAISMASSTVADALAALGQFTGQLDQDLNALRRNGMNEFVAGIEDVQAWLLSSTQEAHQLARATGQSAASTELLTAIQTEAAVRIGQAIAALDAATVGMIASLYEAADAVDEVDLSRSNDPLAFITQLANGFRETADAIDPQRYQQALQIAQNLFNLGWANQADVLEIGDRMRLPFDRFLRDLGVDLAALTDASNFDGLVQAARALGVELPDLAARVGVNLGSLADASSMLNDGFERALGRLSADQAGPIRDLLRQLETAPQSDRSGIVAQIETLIGRLSPELRQIFAPFLDNIDVTPPEVEQINATTRVETAVNTGNSLLLRILAELEATGKPGRRSGPDKPAVVEPREVPSSSTKPAPLPTAPTNTKSVEDSRALQDMSRDLREMRRVLSEIEIAASALRARIVTGVGLA